MNTLSHLSRYLARQFTMGFLVILFAISTTAFVFDVVELLRRASGRDYVSFGSIMAMAFLKLPQLMEQILPFVILFGGLYVFWRLAKSQELVIARASGISVWQFLRPSILVALLIGLVQIFIFNAFSSAMYTRYEQLEAKYFKAPLNRSFIGSDSIWLRQADDNQIAYINASAVRPDLSLSDVHIFLFDKSYAFKQRIDGEEASLGENAWSIKNALTTTAEGEREHMAAYSLPTNLSIEKIQDSFASPETLSFWELPGFIGILEQAGFSALRHQYYFHQLLSTPLLLCAMLIIAACFAINPSRHRRTFVLVASGIGAGFAFYVFSNVVGSLGQSGRIPIVMAAWIPAFVCLLMGITLLLHQEDG